MALSRHHAALNRPLSVQEIVSQAEDFEFSTTRSLQQWLRAGKLLLTEAALCEEDGNFQMAYLYLYRHGELILDRLPQHPDYKDASFKEDLAQARKALQLNLPKLEQWKPRITQDYQRYAKAVERRNAEKQRVPVDQANAGLPQSARDSRRRRSTVSDDGALGDGSQTLQANEHSQLAVDLAHREIRRRDATRQTTRQAGISPGTVAQRRRGLVVDDTDPGETTNGTSHDGVREAGRYLHPGNRQPSGPQRQTQTSRDSATQAYHYPTVPAREDAIDWKMPAMQPSPSLQTPLGRPPTLPAKQAFPTPTPRTPPKPPAPQDPPPPAPKYTFRPHTTTERGLPLRTLLLPPDLRPTFLALAHPNTTINLETCAILCGTLISNALFITHLLLPAQHSTADTCDTTPEGDTALFDYCDAHSLLVCGWIHTHPTQTCFLSSRDLHTSSGYQVMLPEAIAIVCAPRREPDWGCFRLTDPPGLEAVLGCTVPGAFHPHKEGGLYTDALRPGHVVEGPGLQFEVVDLRNG